MTHVTVPDKSDGAGSLYFDTLEVVFNNPNGDTMTPALVNGLRRTMLSGVKSMSFGLTNNRVIINSSFLNTDYIRHRLALVPIYTPEPVDEQEIEKGHLIFRLCDKNDYSRPLLNDNPVAHKVTVWNDLIALRLRKEHRGLIATIAQLSHFSRSSIPVVSPLQSSVSMAPEQTQEGGAKGDGDDDEKEDGSDDEASLSDGPDIDDKFEQRNDEFQEQNVPKTVDTQQKESSFDDDQEESRFIPVLKTHEDWLAYYEPVSTRELIKYNFYLTKLKYKEELLVQIIPIYERGSVSAGFSPCVQAGYSFGQKGADAIQSGAFDRSKIVTQFPKKISLSLEFNGHYPNPVTFNLTVDALRNKIESFRTQLELLNSVDTSEENEQSRLVDLTRKFVETANAALTADDKDRTRSFATFDDFLVIEVPDETHTLGNLIATYGTLIFQEALLAQKRDHLKVLKNFFCSYRLPHPLENKIWIQVKAPSKELWGGPFNEKYAKFTTPYQILYTVTDRIDQLLSEVAKETRGLWAPTPKFDGRSGASAK